MNKSLFPSNPKHRMTIEVQPGVLFQYDATLNSWIKLTTNGMVIPLASHINNGAMSADDFKKLNRLILPPPISSITGTDCVNPFQMGVIGLFSGDRFVGVNGTVEARNIDSRGQTISDSIPFQIHKHTYGFDFTIDFPSLIDELKNRKQFNVVGKKGGPGAIGAKGVAGPDMILSGPPGDAGPAGSAPACNLSVEPDSLAVTPRDGTAKALVAANVVIGSDGQYTLVFDRQSIGLAGIAAEQFHVQSDTSPWVLAIQGNQTDGPVTGANPSLCSDFASTLPQTVYYLDVEPLLVSIRQQFLSSADTVKTGYENVVKFWIQTMSDLFDEQKSALCCALEHCMSVSKNAELRQQIDSLAATAAGSANILLHNKTSDEAVSMSSTRLLKDVGGADLCRGGPPFPQFPNVQGGGHGGFGPPPPSTTPTQTIKKEAVADEAATTDRAIITIDPLVNLSAATGVQVPLRAGSYSVIIKKADAFVDGKFKADARLTYFDGGTKRVVKFLDKGEFANAADAKAAYEGLSLSFAHGGGMVTAWLPNFSPRRAFGSIELVLQPAEAISLAKLITKTNEALVVNKEQPQIQLIHDVAVDCKMSVSHLAWYERGWLSGNCCGVVINIMGQDYIVVKRSIGMDQGCGGGESENEPCIAAMANHPAFAWPTLDGKNFAPLPDAEYVTFNFNERLNEVAATKIANNEIMNRGGQLTGTRNLSFHLSTILFPVHL